MVLAGVTKLAETLATRVALGDPLFGELAGLDLFENRLHALLGVGVDDARAASQIAVLGSVTDAVTHAGDAFFVHQVDDELHLVQALEVRHLRLVAGLDQRLVTGLHQRGETAAQHDLLAEQVGLGLFGEGRLDDARSPAADRRGVRQRDLLGLARRVLRHGDERRHAATLGVRATNEVTGALRRDHDDVDALGRRDALEANVEAVRERERLAVGEVLLHMFVVDLLLFGVGRQHHDDVGPLRRVGERLHVETGFFRLGDRRRAVAQSDDHVDAGVLQVQRVGVTLAAVTDDRNFLAADDRDVGVLVVVNVRCH